MDSEFRNTQFQNMSSNRITLYFSLLLSKETTFRSLAATTCLTLSVAPKSCASHSMLTFFPEVLARLKVDSEVVLRSVDAINLIESVKEAVSTAE